MNFHTNHYVSTPAMVFPHLPLYRHVQGCTKDLTIKPPIQRLHQDNHQFTPFLPSWCNRYVRTLISTNKKVTALTHKNITHHLTIFPQFLLLHSKISPCLQRKPDNIRNRHVHRRVQQIWPIIQRKDIQAQHGKSNIHASNHAATRLAGWFIHRLEEWTLKHWADLS